MSIAATAQESQLSSNLISSCLSDVMHALAGRPGLKQAQIEANSNAALTLILSLLPQDAMQMILAGQATLFNALTADAATEILRRLTTEPLSKARANVTMMGRLVFKELETVCRLQGRLGRAAPKAVSVKATIPAEPPVEPPAPPVEAEPLPQIEVSGESIANTQAQPVESRDDDQSQSEPRPQIEIADAPVDFKDEYPNETTAAPIPAPDDPGPDAQRPPRAERRREKWLARRVMKAFQPAHP